MGVAGRAARPVVSSPTIGSCARGRRSPARACRGDCADVARDADGVVEGDRLADLPARVGGVVLLIDRGALYLQDEAVLVPLEEMERLARHGRQAPRLVAGRLSVLQRWGGVPSPRVA